MLDMSMTGMHVIEGLMYGGFALAFIFMIGSLLCCRDSTEEQAAAQRRAALAEYERSLTLVELMSPVVQVAAAAAPVVAAKKLGYFPYSAEGRRASEKLVCAICLEVFEHGEECSEVPDCRHMFHRDCIGVWMKTKTSCPMCRRSIVIGSSEHVSAADDMV